MIELPPEGALITLTVSWGKQALGEFRGPVRRVERDNRFRDAEVVNLWMEGPEGEWMKLSLACPRQPMGVSNRSKHEDRPHSGVVSNGD